MSDEHVRRPLASLVEQGVQLIHDLVHGARPRTKLAPSGSGAVIRADAREPSDAWLHQAPINRKIAGAGLQDDRWLCAAGLARAVQMQLPPADINQSAGWRKGWRSRGVLCL